jgi:predicted O-methyltransferase YrrM
MNFEKVRSAVSGIPHISELNGRYLYDLIIECRPNRILELGIGHGTGTCYMAAALDELGQGSITSVDLPVSAGFQPNVETMLSWIGLEHLVTVHRMKSGYTWFLHDEIAANTTNDACRPTYDLCIIDGPKNWTTDGAAFFMVDKLLNPGGWIIFDDYEWAYGASSKPDTDGVRHDDLSDAELRTPQIREVFELLVKQHPSYGEFRLLDHSWALARKSTNTPKTYTVIYRETATSAIGKAARKAYRRLRR